MKTAINQDIVKTMLIPLWARAIEQNQAEPIIIDKQAYSILKRVGYDLDYLDEKKQKASQIGCCIRGKWIDDQILNFISENKSPIQVIQLGAGLDARFERLEKNDNIAKWYDLDLPEAMAIRESVIEDDERKVNLAMDMFNTEWLKILSANQLRTIIVIEGVLMYFSENQISELFNNIYQYLPDAVIIFDSVGKRFVGNSKHHDVLSKTKEKVEFLWGSKDEKDVEALNPHILVEKYEFMHQIRGAERFPMFMRLFLKIPFFYKSFMQRLIRVKFKS